MNENKFTGMADNYAKHRPAYPEALMDYLFAGAGFNRQSVIADIGSGTGILTELLLLRKIRVFGVEPNDEMRKTAERNLGRFENFVSVNGSAENTTLREASCDFITAAQAFHWFDRLKFKAESKRILKPNGKVVIIYNNRDSGSPLVTENEEINKRYCPAFKGFSGGMANLTPDDFSDFFKDGVCEFKTFQNNLIYDEQGFIGRSLSASYAPKKHERNYAEYIGKLKSLFQKYSINGWLVLPTVATSFAGGVK